jgi:cell wall-associated NlpC family hydrolase
MKTLSALLYADLLDKPFREGARGPSAYDCVGLASEVLERLGRKLPPFVSDIAELHRQLAAGGALEDSRRIEHPVAGCVALVRMVDDERHVGIMVDPYRMLHTSRQTQFPVVERILTPLFQRRILGFYDLTPPEETA